MSLIVTGSIGIDTILTARGHANDVLGGSAIYFAAAASFFGPVKLVAAVGEDFPPAFLNTFKHFQVDLAGLEQRAGSKTFRWTGQYHQNMNQRDTLKVELNVLAEKLPPVPEAYRGSRFVFLANTHPAGQLELLNQFPSRQLVVADTMDLWINNEPALLRKLLQQIDGLVLNDSESQLLTGRDNLVTAARDVLRLGPKFVVIKKGEHGAMLMHQDGLIAMPAWPTEKVNDPTGAGDSFAGGMMGYLAAKSDASLTTLKQAMAYGTVMASFNIEDFSLGRLRTLSKAELDERYAQFVAMLRL